MNEAIEMPKSIDQIIKKSNELSSAIEAARTVDQTDAQKHALVFAAHIVKTSQTIVLLSNSQAYIEAHTICRLLFEHIFNLGALLSDEKHLDRLKEHAKGEPSRQLKKISTEQKNTKTLTPENSLRLQEFLDDEKRADDPKTGLNWEQISTAGNTDCYYTAYRYYSFLYAHSTLAVAIRPISQSDVDSLHKNVWSILEMSRLLIKSKFKI